MGVGCSGPTVEESWLPTAEEEDSSTAGRYSHRSSCVGTSSAKEAVPQNSHVWTGEIITCNDKFWAINEKAHLKYPLN